VKPTRSANRTLTSRRSAIGSAALALAGSEAELAGVIARLLIGAAHSEQNLAAGRLVAPQLGQRAANGVAHSMQKRAPARFSVPHVVQITKLRIAERRLGSLELHDRPTHRWGATPSASSCMRSTWPS
jgi:hypothetical protein